MLLSWVEGQRNHNMLLDASHAILCSGWPRTGATKRFGAVPETYNGAMSTGYLCACCTEFTRELLTRYADIGAEPWWAWLECLFTMHGLLSLLLQSFRSSFWMDFRIHRSPAQLTMLHTRRICSFEHCLPLMRGALYVRFKNFES